MTRSCVREVMRSQPQVVDADASLLQASVLMRECDCGALPVLRDGELAGMLTDRDIVVRALAEGADAGRTSVKEAMTVGALTCYEDDSVAMAADVMGDNGVQRVVVLDRRDRIVGIVSVADIVKRPDRNAVNDEALHHLYRYA